MNNVINEASVLVTGGNGQLATELKKILSKAVFVDVDVLDITDLSAVLSYVKSHGIEIIVNCAAYTAVDKAEDEEDFAYKVNAIGPENLAKTKCKLIHVSTDYVFDGNGCVPYKTTDNTNPLSAYGRTKLAGEKAVMSNSDTAIIIRTAWLYSSQGNNFVKTMIRLGKERDVLNVVNDQIGSPTFAGDLAKAIVKIIPQLNPTVKGIYHYTNEGVCSWYDFAHAIITNENIECSVNPVSSEQYPTKAHRPSYSVLDKSLIKKTFGVEVPYWMESLKKCLKQF
ncbi:dTDP-4-dehydrorhamnose reductase [Succinimonas amylolytica]|uniref:dTDP-4-dehydrorhamnose reductase n=1 Tax=Succinimonas amylolytica TaxID=83769 RepID=UPI0003622203|nr:dTDP-4-dehydrorhamnose reductase [Succinimonas amylolytica]